MKNIFLIFLSVSMLTCSLDDGTESPQNNGKWNLINISGGITGNEINLQTGDVTWVFDEINSDLIIEYNINDDPAGLLRSGTYNFEIKTINNKSYLFVDNVELGNIVVGNDRFTLNQNILSTGNASDLYVFTFVR